jgi:hypothetical protein
MNSQKIWVGSGIRDPERKTYPGSGPRCHKTGTGSWIWIGKGINRMFLPCLAWRRTTGSSAEDRVAASEPRLETHPSFSVNKPSVYHIYIYNFLFEKITMQSSLGKKYFLFIAMKILVSTAG